MPNQNTGRSCPSLFSLFLLGLCLSLPSIARAQGTVYDDGLASGWASYSWAKVAFDNAAPVHGGKHSISVSVPQGSYGALELRAGPREASGVQAVSFWINGGPEGGQKSLVVKASVDGKQQGSVPIPMLLPNAWAKVTVPLTALGVDKAAKFTGFLIQQNSSDAAPIFYVDDIELALAPLAPVHKGPVKPLAFTGVNLSGGEFGDRHLGQTAIYGRAYTYPQASEMDYFAGKGVNIVRIPFRWTDLQPDLNRPLNAEAFARYKAVVQAATDKKLVVLLDPHDYARRWDEVLGTPGAPNDAFADFWGRLAAEFKNNPRVWLGLMNEPHDMPAAQWLGAANAAIAAIRKTGATNWILVPGVDWTGAHSWVSGGSGAVMLGVKDPLNHYVFEVHQYLNSDNSGSKPDIVSATVGPERLAAFTAWCRKNHQRGFLGEFGASATGEAAQSVENMLGFMEDNRDVWVGFTWWSAGPWWGDYMFSLEPKNGQDRPQMSYLRPHFQAKPVH